MVLVSDFLLFPTAIPTPFVKKTILLELLDYQLTLDFWVAFCAFIPFHFLYIYLFGPYHTVLNYHCFVVGFSIRICESSPFGFFFFFQDF